MLIIIQKGRFTIYEYNYNFIYLSKKINKNNCKLDTIYEIDNY